MIQGGGRGERHSLTAPRIVLGRLDSHESPAFGNLLFPEPTVSRVHATLDWDETANRYLLTHKSATNPTLVNKVRISQPRHIHPGDKIQMGNLILEIRVGIGQHAEVELATVDFTALTKRAANQVYRPETVMPEAPAVPAAGPQSPQENPAPIPAPIPPPSRRNLPPPVFHEPYAPVLIEASRPVFEPLLEFPEPDEQVKPVQHAPRRIQLSSLPRQDEAVPEQAPVEAVPVLRLALEIPKVELEDEWVVIEDSVEPELLEPIAPALEGEEGKTKEQPVDEETAENLAEELMAEEPSAQEEAAEGLAEELASAEAPAEQEAVEALAEELMAEEEEAAESLAEALVSEEPSTRSEPAGTKEATEFAPLETEKPKPKPVRREVRKVGRNEKCPCGSGKKYKKCCGSTAKK